MRTIDLLLVGAVGIVVTAACGGSGPSDADTSSQSSPIIGGTTTPHAEIAKIEGNGIGAGILISPTLLLTTLDLLGTLASASSDAAQFIDCADPTAGAFRHLTKDPVQLNITFGNQVVHGTQFITLDDLNVCSGDIAIVVLSSPVTGVTTPQLLWDSVPAVNSQVTGCGWGGTNIKCAPPTDVQCGNGPVLIANGGLLASDRLTIAVTQGVADIQACGDTGGAVYDPNGALVGVIGANTLQSDPSKVTTVIDPCGQCIGGQAGYTLISSFPDFIAKAFASQGLAPWRAGHPKPVDVGGVCTDALDCNSQLCIGVGAAHYCSQYCDTVACSNNTVCTALEGRSVCLPKVSPHPASCDATASMGRGDPSDARNVRGVAAVLGLVALIFGRRRRHSVSPGKAKPSC